MSYLALFILQSYIMTYNPAPGSLILTKATNIHQLREQACQLEQEGFNSRHIIPPNILIGNLQHEHFESEQINNKEAASLPKKDFVKFITNSIIEQNYVNSLSNPQKAYLQAWNILQNEKYDIHSETKRQFYQPPPNDMMVEPMSVFQQKAYPTDYFRTSDYFSGSVAVGIIMPESDGTIRPSTEDWTGLETSKALAETIAALDWWIQTEPDAGLQFVHESQVIETGYEPINQTVGPNGEESLWVMEIMRKLGYTGPGPFNVVRDYINDLRTRLGTRWSFAVFLVDSSHDTDNRFPNGGYFAYAYLGGPYIVATTGNDGWGEDLLDMTLAHEFGHIFLALDEYASSGCTCDQVGGRTLTPNMNCENCAPDLKPCIMRGGVLPYNAHVVCQYTREMFGWELKPSVKLTTNQQVFTGSDTLDLCIGATHYGLKRDVELYILLEYNDSLFFYPSWSSRIEAIRFEMPVTLDVASVPLLSIQFVPGTPAFEAAFHAVLVEAGSQQVFSTSSTPFQYQ